MSTVSSISCYLVCSPILQNAVGAFYDYLGSGPIEDFGMKIEGSVLEPQGPIQTGTRFTLTWVVVNTGQYITHKNYYMI